MPRKAKEKIDEFENAVEKETSKNEKNAKTTKTKQNKTSKKESGKELKSDSKKAGSKTTTKSKTKSSTKEATPSKKTKTKEEKNKEPKQKSTSSNSTKKSKAKSTTKKIEILEYYDLPYRYNQTVVKILAQTPNNLFVYWDISDEDINQYINQYGEYFFNNTKPVLIVHNITKKYDFEVDINDFANSWYLHVKDSNCDYVVELGRRPINQYIQIVNNYLHIATSNDMISQNDHILFEKLSHIVYFKNVKTNKIISKELANLNLSLLQKIGKLSTQAIKEFYKKLYPNESINFDRLDLKNPSSSNPSSSFK